MEAREQPAEATSRTERRRLRTRAALVSAAQTLMADGREHVAIADITRLADVGQGSFYNHFAGREELYAAALDDALERLGGILDTLADDAEDPAVSFSRSFRLAGRLIRLHPQVSRLLIRHSATLLRSELGLAPRARRDIDAAVRAGRFRVDDPVEATALAAGALVALGALLLDDPARDDAAAADRMTHGLLLAFGMAPEEATELVGMPLPDVDPPLPDAID